MAGNEKINEGINHSAGIDIMLLVITINLILHILSVKQGFSNYTRYENLTGKIQALEGLTTDDIQGKAYSFNPSSQDIETGGSL